MYVHEYVHLIFFGAHTSPQAVTNLSKSKLIHSKIISVQPYLSLSLLLWAIYASCIQIYFFPIAVVLVSWRFSFAIENEGRHCQVGKQAYLHNE